MLKYLRKNTACAHVRGRNKLRCFRREMPNPPSWSCHRQTEVQEYCLECEQVVLEYDRGVRKVLEYSSAGTMTAHALQNMWCACGVLRYSVT